MNQSGETTWGSRAFTKDARIPSADRPFTSTKKNASAYSLAKYHDGRLHVVLFVVMTAESIRERSHHSYSTAVDDCLSQA